MSVTTGHEVENSNYRGRCRRGFFRVHSWLPVRLSSLDQQGARTFSNELNTPAEESASLADGQLEARLSHIEDKLDMLLRSAGHEVAVPLSQSEKSDVEISGSGLRVNTGELFAVEDRIKVELVLPEECGRTISLLGRVVTVSEAIGPKRKCSVALFFETVRDRDREAIVRHAYEVQRLLLGREAKRDRLR